MKEQDLQEIEACRASWIAWLRGDPCRGSNDVAASEGLNRACEALLKEVRRLQDAALAARDPGQVRT